MANTNLAEDKNNVPAQKQEKPTSRNVTRLETRRAVQDVMNIEKERVEQGLPDASPGAIGKREQREEATRIQALGGTEGSEEVKTSMADIMKDEEERADKGRAA